MYVLHHADQPELYHGPPKDPKIDTSVSLWKGALKPLAAAGFIATLRVDFPLHRYWPE